VIFLLSIVCHYPAFCPSVIKRLLSAFCYSVIILLSVSLLQFCFPLLNCSLPLALSYFLLLFFYPVFCLKFFYLLWPPSVSVLLYVPLFGQKKSLILRNSRTLCLYSSSFCLIQSPIKLFLFVLFYNPIWSVLQMP
jgi:hypothetical protein